MDHYTVLPDRQITKAGVISSIFLDFGIKTFIEACRYVHQLPYGYNSDRDDLMILFKEEMGSCTTKHAVVATLAKELDLPVFKNIGIYPMTEEIVTGADNILGKYDLPYVPMVHCFLVYGEFRVDLTEGNQNGKNQSIETFLHIDSVKPNMSEKEEYLLYRDALKEMILKRDDLQGIDIKTILQAREEGIKLLKENVLNK